MMVVVGVVGVVVVRGRGGSRVGGGTVVCHCIVVGVEWWWMCGREGSFEALILDLVKSVEMVLWW